MSAIWALVCLDGRPVDVADLERMSAALAPLGPEAVGIWHGGPAGLGHRLMSFTPEDQLEQQPLLSAEGGPVLVVDGRLDNRPELARELSLAPGETRCWPDSSFVLAAYQRWGEDCPSHLIGALAFIVWDPARRRLFAASTPGNNATLFYYHTPQFLAMATMPRGLLPLPFVPLELDEQKLAEFVVFGREHRAATFHRGLRRLQSGHTLTCQNGALDVRRYWAPDLSRRIVYPRDDDYVDAFHELFERVVSDHLRSITPVAAMLSGGLDSSTVAVTAARQLAGQGQRLATYTEVPGPSTRGVALPGWYNDETPRIQAITRQQTNLDPAFLNTDGQCFLDHLPALFSSHEAPLHNTANFVWLNAILRQAADSGQRVVLMGDMGNLTMSWAGNGLMADYLRRGRARAAWREARALARSGQSRSPWRALVNQGVWPLLPEPLWLTLEKLRHPDFGRSYLAIRPGYAQAHGTGGGPVWRNYAGRPNPDGRRTRYDFFINKTDSYKVAWRGQFGVDARDPTGDQRLIDFCLAIPDDQFLRDGQSRWLIRRAMAGRLPPDVLSSTRRGMQASDWFDRLSARQPQIEQILSRLEQDDLGRQMLDLERLRGLLGRWPAPQPANQQIVRDYGLLLQQGLMAGSFILWFHGQP